jgi:ABC-type transport system involved in multi-copper enzyme maturation permease subunit
VAALVGVLTMSVWILGLHLHHAYAAAVACHPASSIACGDLATRFNGMNDFLANGFILQVVPALIGAFVGAPLLARELETGTFRYAWTQGFGRWRWALAKLAGLALVLIAAAAALSALFSWYFQPYLATRNQPLSLVEASPFTNGLFELRGVSYAAWTLVAFAIGGLAGMLIRRVVPAIVATLTAYAGLALATAVYLRQHYLAPLITSNVNVPSSAWITSQWWTKSGAFAFAGQPPQGVLQRFCPPPPQSFGKSPQAYQTLLQCLTRHGYTQWTAYQPAGRFWSFQWIEGGWLLALSVLLIAVTVGLVRWRAA